MSAAEKKAPSLERRRAKRLQAKGLVPRPKRLLAPMRLAVREMVALRDLDPGDPLPAVVVRELAQVAEEWEGLRWYFAEREDYTYSDWAGRRAAEIRLLAGLDKKLRVRDLEMPWQTRLSPGGKGWRK